MGGPSPHPMEERVLQLAAEGYGRNRISRVTGLPWSTVSLIAHRNGVRFENTKALEGVEANRREWALRRSELALRLLDDVERIREQLFEPMTQILHGGKDFIRVDVDLDEPVPTDKAALARAATMLLDRSIKLDEYGQQNNGADQGRALVGNLGRLFTLAAQAMEDPEEGSDPE